MTARFRPIHCGFDTLRHASERLCAARTYRRGVAANEQITARGMGNSTRIARPASIFADFREY